MEKGKFKLSSKEHEQEIVMDEGFCTQIL